MIWNYIKISLRTLKKQRLYTAINIAGFCVGLASAILIFIYMFDEYSVDKFHAQAGRIYRVVGHVKSDSDDFWQAVTSAPFGPKLKEEMPEVADVVRVDVNDAVVEKGEIKFEEDDILFTDPSFFSMFDFKLLKGNPSTALSNPYQIVLSESVAAKYFGEKDPIGQTIKLFLYDRDGKGADYKVTGVVEDCPGNTQFQYTMLGSFSTYEQLVGDIYAPERWFDNGFYTFLLLNEKTDKEELLTKVPAFSKKNMGRLMDSYEMNYTYDLQPLESIYLTSNIRYEMGRNGNVNQLWLFGILSIFILVLAVTNSINIATTVSLKRHMEIGVRKVFGASRRQLINQYLTESIVISFLSFVIALSLVASFKGVFVEITDKPSVNFFQLEYLLFFGAVALFTGLVAGGYPAIALSKLIPQKVLKGELVRGKSGFKIKDVLMVVQFTISLSAVIGVMVIVQQMSFISNKNLGYSPEKIITLKYNGSFEVHEGYEEFRNELVQFNAINEIGRSRTSIVNGLGNSLGVSENKKGEPVSSSIYRLPVDFDFMAAYDLEMVEGRRFDKSIITDKNGFIVNEAALAVYGWDTPHDAIGKPFSMNSIEGEIIGVVKNFHYNSLSNSIAPMVMFINPRSHSIISIRYEIAEMEAALAEISAVWKKHFPNSILSYGFMEKRVANQYQSEQKFQLVFQVFSAICLIIACMGLFGMASLTTNQRMKEMGIRKVLGAHLKDLFWILTKPFAFIMIISLVIAVPLSLMAMETWLSQFAYQVDINPVQLLVAVLAVFVLAMVSISYQLIKAAYVNPIKYLKDD